MNKFDSINQGKRIVAFGLLSLLALGDALIQSKFQVIVNCLSSVLMDQDAEG
jgi:hypothetical protein